MTRTTTLAALAVAALGLAACETDDTAMMGDSQVPTGVTNPGESPNTGDVVADPTEGVESGPES